MRYASKQGSRAKTVLGAFGKKWPLACGPLRANTQLSPLQQAPVTLKAGDAC